MPLKKISKKHRRAKQAARLPPGMATILAARGDPMAARGGRNRWRDQHASHGAASAVRQIVKDGKPVETANG